MSDAKSIKLARAYVELDADPKPIQQSLSKVGQTAGATAGNVGKAVQGLTGSMDGLGGALNSVCPALNLLDGGFNMASLAITEGQAALESLGAVIKAHPVMALVTVLGAVTVAVCSWVTAEKDLQKELKATGELMKNRNAQYKTNIDAIEEYAKSGRELTEAERVHANRILSETAEHVRGFSYRIKYGKLEITKKALADARAALAREESEQARKEYEAFTRNYNQKFYWTGKIDTDEAREALKEVHELKKAYDEADAARVAAESAFEIQQRDEETAAVKRYGAATDALAKREADRVKADETEHEKKLRALREESAEMEKLIEMKYWAEHAAGRSTKVEMEERIARDREAERKLLEKRITAAEQDKKAADAKLNAEQKAAEIAENKRKKEERDKRQAEQDDIRYAAGDYVENADKTRAQEEKTKQKEKAEEKDAEKWGNMLKTNPNGAAFLSVEGIRTATARRNDAERNYNQYASGALKDGDVSEAEKERLAELLVIVENSDALLAKWKARRTEAVSAAWDAARGEAKKSTEPTTEVQRAASFEAFQKGTTETRKQILEDRQRARGGDPVLEVAKENLNVSKRQLRAMEQVAKNQGENAVEVY